MGEHRIQVVTHALWLVLQRHVRNVMHAIQHALRVRIKRSEQRIEIALCWAGGSDEFEGLAQRTIGPEAADENLSDLTSRNDAVTGIACVAFVALEEDEPVLIRTIVVEPAGSDDRVRQPARSHEPFGSPLPVMGLGGTVVIAGAVGDSDGGHERDARCPGTQRTPL